MLMSTEFTGRRMARIVGLFALAAGSLVAKAQSASEPKLDLTPTLPSLNEYLHDTTPSASYSSSVVASVEPEMNFSSEMQPPPRRQYGRPRYNDRNHNPDGSNRYTFMVGGGFVSPVGSTSNYQTIGWKIAVGGGVNFNKYFGVLLQYDYDRMNIPSYILRKMISDYSAIGFDASGLDGNTHLWSVTLNPILTFMQNDSSSAYITGGGGFYRKVTNFTLPQVGYYCDYFYGCYPVQSNQTFDHYSNNAGGVNIGLGFTHKLSHYSSQKLFAEARYTWVDNQPNNNIYYTPNNYRTSYIPVTFGLRW